MTFVQFLVTTSEFWHIDMLRLMDWRGRENGEMVKELDG